jgi:membrane protein DedA with SNARE-associated domain
LTSGTSKITPERWQQIEGLYQKFGAPLLLLSAVPGLGLPLTTGAGAVGIGRAEFVVWVFIGKLVRNWLLVLIVFLGIDLAGFLNSKVLGREPLPDETVPDSPEPGFFSQWLLSKPPRPK